MRHKNSGAISGKKASGYFPLPPPLVPPNGADITRENLLTASHELLFKRGTASVATICERAGTNVAMVKYCFGGKDQMMVALLERLCLSLAAEIDGLDKLPLTRTEKLRRHIVEMARNYVRFPYLNRLVTDQLRLADGPGARTLAVSFAVPMHAWYKRILSDGYKAGEFRKIDPTFFFFSIMGLCEFVFLGQGLLPHAFGIKNLRGPLLEKFLAHTSEFVLNAVKA